MSLVQNAILSSILGGVVVVIVAVLAPVVLLAFAIFIIGVSNKSDPDPRGTRPVAAYAYSAAFLFLWTAVFAVVAAVDSLINLIGNSANGSVVVSFGGALDPDKLAARACVLGAIVLVLAGGAYLVHLRRGNALADLDDDASGPTKRVMRSFVAFVSFVSILLAVAACIGLVYTIFELASPSTFGGFASRTADLRALLDAAVLLVAAGSVFAYHQRLAPASMRLLGGAGARRLSAPSGPPSAPAG